MLQVFAVVSKVMRKHTWGFVWLWGKTVVLLDIYIIRSRIVLNTFFEVFSWLFPQICNILARAVLVIELPNKRFQQKLINLKKCKRNRWKMVLKTWHVHLKFVALVIGRGYNLQKGVIAFKDYFGLTCDFTINELLQYHAVFKKWLKILKE